MKNELNILSEFCAVRDFDIFNREKRMENFGFEKADIMVLFGGSILCGGDLFAKAIQQNIAKKYIIVGGAGHTTDALRAKMAEFLTNLDTKNMTEAELLNHYIYKLYGVKADFLETKSTNCGNNITFLIDLIEKEKLDCQNIILSQDASMQKRMWATLKKYMPKANIVNYAGYKVKFTDENGVLGFDNYPKGMWDTEHYSKLLMGEIPRLSDDENGYGPNGAGYICHVDIPQDVVNAFEVLKKQNEKLIRTANPKFKG